MNAQEPEILWHYGRYLRDFFPGQPFRNSYKRKGYRNIDGRCTPGIPDAAAPNRRGGGVLALAAAAAALLYLLA